MIAALAILATLSAEALAFYTIAELLAVTFPEEQSTAAVSAFTFVIVTLVAFSLPRLVAGAGTGVRAARIAMAVVTFVVIYGALRVELAGDLAIWSFSWAFDFAAGRGAEFEEVPRPLVSAALVVVAWVRGTWLSLSGVEFESTPRQLAAPAGTVLIASVLGAASAHDELIARGALAFFAVAIVALAFSQSALSGATFGDIRAGGVTTSLLVVSGVASLVGVVAFGIAFGVIGGPVAHGLVAAVQLFLAVTVAPLVAGGEWLIGLLDLKPGDFDPQDVFANGDQSSDDAEQDEGSLARRSFLVLVRTLGLAAGVVLLVGLIVAFSGRWRRYRRPADGAMVVSSSGSLAEDLGALVPGLFRRGHGETSSVSSDALVRLYQRILRAAQASGRDRAPGQTPAEFAPALNAAFGDPVTDDVTRALEADLYADAPPAPARLAELERRWSAHEG